MDSLTKYNLEKIERSVYIVRVRDSIRKVEDISCDANEFRGGMDTGMRICYPSANWLWACCRSRMGFMDNVPTRMALGHR